MVPKRLKDNSKFVKKQYIYDIVQILHPLIPSLNQYPQNQFYTKSKVKNSGFQREQYSLTNIYSSLSTDDIW